MFRNVVVRLVTETGRVKNAPLIQRLTATSVSVRSFSGVKDAEQQQPFDGSLLEFLVCPLSKKPLRYEAETNELINEELGIAFPIIDGIPNMIPQEARLLQKDTDASTSPTQG
ncbi:protein preY, mitochondrial-like [Cyclopterus lumpus]|uniref:Protein preY, mitochondrial n=1 Tax=Cyclopterus lumpus TaxID=8103 RepID=A0A8C2WKV9_CYCLU|nr:protein preY, mitochondrial-like [Cyclopterus lumpus]